MNLYLPKILVKFLIFSCIVLVPSILFCLWTYLYSLAFGNTPSDWLQIVVLTAILFYSIIS